MDHRFLDFLFVQFFQGQTTMNRKQTFTIAAAALSGLLAGSAARAAVVSPTRTGNQLTSPAGQKAIPLDTAAHDCKGQNACKGQGGCKTGDNGCKGKNSCKGNGGCKVSATTKPSAM
jgi:hypothetical protein